jgi:hypothetical protein
MLKTKVFRLIALIAIVGLLSITILAPKASAFGQPSMTGWYWYSDTTVKAVAAADVNADGQTELVTAGYFNNGTTWIGQIVIWNAATMGAIRFVSWAWNDTNVNSIAVANLTGGNSLDIVTGGSFFDGLRWNAQLMVWNSTTLAVERQTAWYWTNDTQISSVAVADITTDPNLDIVTGGSFFDGTRNIAQLIVWNATDLALERVTAWYWTSNTYISSVAVANINGTTGNSSSIVTGGAFFDGTRYIAQLITWNATNLALQSVSSWFWTSNTIINSVAVGNLTGGAALSVVTAGTYSDGTRNIAQLIVWDGSNLAYQRSTTWIWNSHTVINSVAVGNFTSGANLDIVTGGAYFDNVKNNAQLIDFDCANLSMKSVTTWSSIASTTINSVAIANFTGTITGNRTVVGSEYYDNLRSIAQLSTWA